jgi:UDP-glucuronate 4-epimerase
MERDFTYIDDIVGGVLSSLDRPPADDGTAKPGGSTSPHALYNLGNNRPEPLGRLIDLIEAACGRPAIRDNQPMQPGDVPATFADIGDAERELGYRPGTSLEIGIPAFVEWYRAYAAT